MTVTRGKEKFIRANVNNIKERIQDNVLEYLKTQKDYFDFIPNRYTYPKFNSVKSA